MLSTALLRTSGPESLSAHLQWVSPLAKRPSAPTVQQRTFLAELRPATAGSGIRLYMRCPSCTRMGTCREVNYGVSDVPASLNLRPPGQVLRCGTPRCSRWCRLLRGERIPDLQRGQQQRPGLSGGGVPRLGGRGGALHRQAQRRPAHRCSISLSAPITCGSLECCCWTGMITMWGLHRIDAFMSTVPACAKHLLCLIWGPQRASSDFVVC